MERDRHTHAVAERPVLREHVTGNGGHFVMFTRVRIQLVDVDVLRQSDPNEVAPSGFGESASGRQMLAQKIAGESHARLEP